jgi:mRNA-degrading endonuclease RelE of RelBE toxin-antitoxin system
MAMMPVNSKRFKRDLKYLRPSELRTLMKLVNKLENKLGRFSAPIEHELYNQTGAFR